MKNRLDYNSIVRKYVCKKKSEGDNKMTTFERDYKEAKEGNGIEVLKRR